MSRITNTSSIRIGTFTTWYSSSWYDTNPNYSTLLYTDYYINEFLLGIHKKFKSFNSIPVIKNIGNDTTLIRLINYMYPFKAIKNRRFSYTLSNLNLFKKYTNRLFTYINISINYRQINLYNKNNKINLTKLQLIIKQIYSYIINTCKKYKYNLYNKVSNLNFSNNYYISNNKKIFKFNKKKDYKNNNYKISKLVNNLLFNIKNILILIQLINKNIILNNKVIKYSFYYVINSAINNINLYIDSSDEKNLLNNIYINVGYGRRLTNLNKEQKHNFFLKLLNIINMNTNEIIKYNMVHNINYYNIKDINLFYIFNNYKKNMHINEHKKNMYKHYKKYKYLKNKKINKVTKTNFSYKKLKNVLYKKLYKHKRYKFLYKEFIKSNKLNNNRYNIKFFYSRIKKFNINIKHKWIIRIYKRIVLNARRKIKSIGRKNRKINKKKKKLWSNRIVIYNENIIKIYLDIIYWLQLKLYNWCNILLLSLYLHNKFIKQNKTTLLNSNLFMTNRYNTYNNFIINIKNIYVINNINKHKFNKKLILFSIKRLKHFSSFFTRYSHSLIIKHLKYKIMNTLSYYIKKRVIYMPSYKITKFPAITHPKLIADYVKHQIELNRKIPSIMKYVVRQHRKSYNRRKITKHRLIKYFKRFWSKTKNKLRKWIRIKNNKIFNKYRSEPNVILDRKILNKSIDYQKKKKLYKNSIRNRVKNYRFIIKPKFKNKLNYRYYKKNKFKIKTNINLKQNYFDLLSIYDKKNIRKTFMRSLRKIKYMLIKNRFKYYPAMGLRIECSGPPKKAKRTLQRNYQDYVDHYWLFGKMPNGTYTSNVQYWQTFGRAKRAGIGIKVWLYTYTPIYSTYNSYKYKFKDKYDYY